MTAQPPLTGTRVLDLLDGAGAYATRLMAGLGAEVVRVEPPGGSAQRAKPPFIEPHVAGRDGPSLYFTHYNCGKQGITLDLNVPAGRELLGRLLGDVDVVFDNGQLRDLGFDLDQLTTAPKPLVVVSVTPFGLRSARAHWLGSDLVCQAMSGMIGLYGYRNERPARFAPEQAWQMAGLAAALGALIAWFGARRTGRGEVVDVAVERVCALVSCQKANASLYAQYGFRARRLDRETSIGSGTICEAKDGYVLLGAPRNVHRFVELLDAVGMHEEAAWIRDVSSQGAVLRPHQQRVLLEFARTRTRWEAAEQLQRFGNMGLPVQDMADLAADLFLQARAFFVEVEEPSLGLVMRDLGPPIRFGATPYRLARRPPLLGEHTADVLARIGVDREELSVLREQGVV